MPPLSTVTFFPLALMIVLVLISLLQKRATRPLARKLFQGGLAPFRALQFLHSGLIGDYVLWMMAGLAALALFA